MRKIVAIVLAVAWSTGCRTAREKAEYEEKRKALVAENAAKEKAANDELQKACKSKTVKAPDKSTVVTACEEQVRARIPSADFPFLRGDPHNDGCNVLLISTYTAGGAEHHYACDFDPRSNKAKLRL